jgi:hypothetical protein
MELIQGFEENYTCLGQTTVIATSIYIIRKIFLSLMLHVPTIRFPSLDCVKHGIFFMFS